MVTMGIGGMESREQQIPNKRRGSTHILLDQRGLRTKEEQKELESALFQPTRHGTGEG
jgi:hypothetical protein